MEAESELKYIFANINDWVKFAEAKHGGFLVFNVGLIIGVLSSHSNIYNFIFKPAMLIGIICFGISVIMSIISLFPVTQNIFNNKKKIIQSPNLYFFGHLSRLDNQSFIDEYKMIDTNFTPSKFDTDLINQILVNARVAQSKFMFFKISCYLTVFGLGLIALSSIIKIIYHF